MVLTGRCGVAGDEEYGGTPLRAWTAWLLRWCSWRGKVPRGSSRHGEFDGVVGVVAHFPERRRGVDADAVAPASSTVVDGDAPVVLLLSRGDDDVQRGEAKTKGWSTSTIVSWNSVEERREFRGSGKLLSSSCLTS